MFVNAVGARPSFTLVMTAPLVTKRVKRSTRIQAGNSLDLAGEVGSMRVSAKVSGNNIIIIIKSLSI
jgi:hypothetical protein